MLLLFVGWGRFMSSADRPFNAISLSQNNSVSVSAGLPKYYDTIIRVGLDKVDIRNQVIYILQLGDESSEEGVVAHIKKFDGKYYLFISDLDKRGAIEVIGHEIWHMVQYESGALGYNYADGIIYWEGDEYHNEMIPYENRPWERDAFNNSSVVSKEIEKLLW